MGFIPASHGQPMIPQAYIPHGERNDRDGMQDHQSNPSSHPMNSTRGSGGGRRGRSRGGNNNMSRRDYSMRQNNQHQQQQNQSSVTSNEYGQPLMDQNQQTVLTSSGPYQQVYFQYSPYYPNAGAPHLAALPGSATAANAQNLTGQPLFAIQQPMHMYPYGSYPIMYNMIQAPAHQMSHQPTDMSDNEHNQNQETSGAAPTVIQSLPWAPHVSYQDQPHIFQHSPHLNPGEDLEFRVAHPDEYHVQMINHGNNFHLIAPDHVGDIVNDIGPLDPALQQGGFSESATIEDEQSMYQDENVAENGGERMLIEKTRDLMIQTTMQDVPKSQLIHTQSAEEYEVVSNERSKIMLDATVPNPQDPENYLPTSPARVVTNSCLETEPTESVSNNSKKTCTVDNKMIVKNKEKPPAWGSVAVPNVVAQTSSVKKQMASVSVSAIPNKDVMHLQHVTEIATQTIDQTMSAQEAVQDQQQFPSQKLFSSITASKLPLSSPNIVAASKKTEHKQNEIQPLQKQVALSEKAKQQIVTTITGVGSVSQETNKKPEAVFSRAQQASTENVSVLVEKVAQPPKPSPPAAQTAAGPARASWAALFVPPGQASNESKAAPPLPAPAPATSPMHYQITETQTKVSTAKTHPEPLSVQITPQVPGVMSYSAVSAQSVPSPAPSFAASVTTIPSQLPTGGVSTSKKLPQSKLNSPSVNHNVENHSKSAPLDQHALRLGGLWRSLTLWSTS